MTKTTRRLSPALEAAHITKVDPALARGAEGKASVHSRKSLDDQRSKRLRDEPEVAVAKTVRAGRKAKAVSPKGSVKVSTVTKSQKVTGSRLILKQNVEVRKLLTAAANAAGGTRLTPIGFDSYTTFLAGVPLDADGNADVAFVPVKGNEPIRGKNVKLTIRGGKVIKVK